MEILHTIWNTLTNENELILNLTGIPMIFIEITLTFLLFTTILNISYTKKQATLYIFFHYLIAIISSYFIEAPYNTFINLISSPLLVYFVLKTNALKAILSEVMAYTIFFFFTTPLIALYTNFFGIYSSQVAFIPIHKMAYSLILYFCIYLLYKVIKHFNWHINFFDKFDRFNYNTFIINFIFGAISIALQGYIEFIYIDYLPTYLVVLSLIVLLFYFFINMYSLVRTSKLEETRQLLETQKLYNENLTTLHDNIRGFKHDFNNIVQTIGGYLSTDNINSLKIYYKDLLDECQINNNLSFLNPEIINNPVIYSLLSDKYHKSIKLDIKLNLEVLSDLSNLNIKMYELSRILGILLDNALEAAAKTDKKTINITFRKDKTRNIDLIIIQNTYVNKDIDINKIFEKGYTSKSDYDKDTNHGLGLWEVRKFLKKHTHLNLYTTKTEEYFSQQFEIYN